MLRHFDTLTQLNILNDSTLPYSIDQPTSTQKITIQQIQKISGHIMGVLPDHFNCWVRFEL